MKIGTIEKGIPLPPEPPRRHTGPKKIYPFDEMKLGDSIFCELEEGDVARKIRGNLKSSYTRYTKSLGFKFEIRAITNSQNEITGFRIWRTE